MAVESNGAAVDPQTVGNAFVVDYYNRLHDSPADVHKFYLQASPGHSDINDLDYQNSNIHILTADSQPSLNNGVVTLVTGLVTPKDGQTTRFSQSFFLVPRNGSYFVLNDSLTYMPLNFVHHDSTQVVTEPADEDSQVVIIPSQVEANGHVEEKVVDRNTNLPKPQVDAPKISYARMVQSAAQNGAPVTGKSPPPPKPKPVQKPSVAPERKASAPVPSSETIEKPAQGGSIFVAKLPMDTTPEQLYETFNGFGTIRKNGIQVRSYAEERNCFGFVAFESGEAVKSVLQVHKNTPIIIGDRRVSIEEKRANNNNNNGGRSYEGKNNYYKNENGYRNEWNRPRGDGFTGGRGNGRNAVERRNGEAAGSAKVPQKNGRGNAHAKN